MDATRHRLIQRHGWDRAAASYEQFWQTQLRPSQELVLAKAALAPGERVLDVACGAGALTVRLAAAVTPGGWVVASDLSPKMVAATTALASASGAGNIEAICGDAEQIAVDGPFDVAICSLGLMYVASPVTAISELHRLVRPGGRVAVSVWGERHRCGWASVFGIVDARVTSDVCPRFFALGAPGILTRLFEQAGFCDIDETRLDVTLDYVDQDEALGAAFLGGPVALAYARFDPRSRQEATAEYLASIAEFGTASGGYGVPGEFVVASARRPD